MLHLLLATAAHALTFGDASKVWTLQRNRATGIVDVVPNSNGYKINEIACRIDRTADNPGLGIGLEELGSTGDGQGLVLIEQCVEGSNAAAASPALLPGDCIISIASAGALPFSVQGCDWDTTVEALGALDPSKGVDLVVKRLERLPRVAVTLQFPPEDERADEKLELLPGMPLRRSILSQGIKLNDPLAVRFDAGWGTGDCGGEGTCATCAFDVVKGLDALSEQDAQERQILKKHPSWRLACKARISDVKEDTELVLKVSPRRSKGDEEDDELEDLQQDVEDLVL